MTDIPEEYLTAKQVQSVLDVSSACLCVWRAMPDAGPPWEKIGNRFLYPVEPFQVYLTALTGGAPVPRGLGHKAKIEMFSRLHDPAPTNRELATRLRAVEQALLSLTRIFSIEQEPAAPKQRRKYKTRKAAKRRVKRKTVNPF